MACVVMARRSPHLMPRRHARGGLASARPRSVQRRQRGGRVRRGRRRVADFIHELAEGLRGEGEGWEDEAVHCEVLWDAAIEKRSQ